MDIPTQSVFREPGAALCFGALVREPALLPGVRSWTVIPRDVSEDVSSVKFSPDGRLVAAAERFTGFIRIWNAVTGDLHKVLAPRSDAACHSLVWSPDGRYIATGSTWGRIQIWEIASGRIVRQFGEIQDIELAWSPDGRHIAAGSHYRSGSLSIFDVKTGQRVHQIQAHKGSALSVAWSPDGKTVASGGYDRTVRFWDPASGKKCFEYDFDLPQAQRLHFSQITDVRWSPDGRTLAVFGGGSCGPGFIGVLDGATGKPAKPMVTIAEGRPPGRNCLGTRQYRIYYCGGRPYG